MNGDFPRPQTWLPRGNSSDRGSDVRRERRRPCAPGTWRSCLSVIHEVIINIRNHFMNQPGAGKGFAHNELIPIEIGPDRLAGHMVAGASFTPCPPATSSFLTGSFQASLSSVALLFNQEPPHPGTLPMVNSESFFVQLGVGHLLGSGMNCVPPLQFMR